MNSLTSFVKRHPLLTFFGLSFAFGWVLWIMSWFGLATFVRINPYGPLFAAVTVTAVAHGESGLKSFLAAFDPRCATLRWYAVAFLLPVTLTLITATLNILLGARAPTADQLAVWPGLSVRFVFTLFCVGLGEEPGWRGFALPRLQQGRSALSAALILGLIWAVWHAPLFTTEEDSRWLPWAIVPPWAMGVVSASILLAWLCSHTNGSNMIPIVMHAANNTVTGGYVWPMFTGTDNLRLWWLQAVVWALAAIVIVILAGPARLARLASQQAKIH